MPLCGFGFSFITERIVVNAIGKIISCERIGTYVDLAVFSPCVIVLGFEHHLAPAVADAQLIVAIFIGILQIDIRVEVFNRPHIIDTVAVRSDHVRENQVVLYHDGVADGVATSRIRNEGKGDNIIAPRGISVRCSKFILRFLPISKIPNQKTVWNVRHIAGQDGRELDFPIGLTHNGDFRSGDKVQIGLRCRDNIIPLDDGIPTAFGSSDDKFHGV